MSGDAIDATIDLDAVADPDFVGDVGIPDGALLLAFTNAVESNDPDATQARSALVDAVGEDGLLEAAATIAVFNGLVRVADGTGIPLDVGLDEYSADDRVRLGIDAFAGAASTTARTLSSTTAGTPPVSIGELFG